MVFSLFVALFVALLPHTQHNNAQMTNVSKRLINGSQHNSDRSELIDHAQQWNDTQNTERPCNNVVVPVQTRNHRGIVPAGIRTTDGTLRLNEFKQCKRHGQRTDDTLNTIPKILTKWLPTNCKYFVQRIQQQHGLNDRFHGFQSSCENYI